MKRKYIYFLILFVFGISFLVLYFFWPKKQYSNSDFGINDIVSSTDYDNDGIDDYTDIYLGALEYVKSRPKYKSKYYNGGYPDDEYGVCTDVVTFAFLNAGYNLRDMVNEDIINNRDSYDITNIDSNIDFRRVKNLKVFFDRNAIKLSNDINDYESFQKGDIVVFNKHIAIISEYRNKKGIPYIIHNSGNYRYVEDGLSRYNIVGHYRWN